MNSFNQEKPLLIEPHYLGSIEYFVLLLDHDHVVLDIHENFVKQTYRNRCKINTQGGVHTLSVPVHYRNNTPLKEVLIDYGQTWVKDHVRAIVSAYAKAPYFDYYWPIIEGCWSRKDKYLIDLKQKLLTVCLDLLEMKIRFENSEKYHPASETTFIDARNLIPAKTGFEQRNIMSPKEYIQNFGNTFVPNLSIIDVLMCEGPNAKEILLGSRAKTEMNK